MKRFFLIISIVISIHSQAQTFVGPTNDPGPCMRDANDPLVAANRDDLKRAVFKYFAGGSSCTGTLINRNTNENSLGQYFITSWHCFKLGNDCAGDNYDFSQAITMIFNYQSPPDHLGQVFSDNKDGAVYSITRNIRLVDHVTCAYGDVAICEILGEPIPAHFNPYFAGWSPAIAPTTSSFVSFGHSQGSLKQVAATNLIQDGLTLNIQTQSCQTVTKLVDLLVGWIWKRRWSTSVICQYVQVPFVDSRYWVYGYTYGNTAGGASGAALFYAGNRIIGNLSGTPFTGCSNTSDSYGKFYSYYPRQSIKNALNPSNKWSVDIVGIPGRNKNCYPVIDYNDNEGINYLFPAKYYQSHNAITLNSNSYVRLGKSYFNEIVIKNQAEFTFNAGTFVELGYAFEVETGATFTANTGVPCGYSGSYRVSSEEADYEEQAKAELYASIHAVSIPDRMELPTHLSNLQLNVQVYPNPATDIITVNLFSVPSETIQIRIYNILGKEVYTNTFTYSNQKELSIPVPFLSNGAYEISFTSGNYIKTEKIIINK